MKNLKGIIMGMGVATAMLASCAGGQQAPQLTVSGLDPAKFDTTLQDKPVKLYTLKNQNGMEVCITNYGGRVVSLVVPDKDGKPTDVVLGFETVSSRSTAWSISCVRTTRTRATHASTACTAAALRDG